MSQEAGRAAPRLRSEDILRATVALIETEGLRKLTMRRLGRALGVEAMSIYHYFPSRQALLDALVDWIVLQTATDPELQFAQGDDWRDYLDRLAHGIRRMALAHPRVFPLIATQPTQAPWIRPPMRSLRWVDSFLGGLLDHDFSPPAAVSAYKQFCSFMLGHLLLEVAALGLDAPETLSPARAGMDADRTAARQLRRVDALHAEAAMADGDGPSAAEIVEAGAEAKTALADQPVILAARPELVESAAASPVPVDSVVLDADIPLGATVVSTGSSDLTDYPQVQALAGLLAHDSAPEDFETQVDQMLDALEKLRDER